METLSKSRASGNAFIPCFDGVEGTLWPGIMGGRQLSSSELDSKTEAVVFLILDVYIVQESGRA